jgi:hypothetical protein
MNQYILKRRHQQKELSSWLSKFHKDDYIWDIYAPYQENKKPVVSLLCSRAQAMQVKISLDHEEGVPLNAIDFLIDY